MKRVIKRLHVKTRSEVIERNKTISHNMASNPDTFPSPNPVLEKYDSDIADAERKCEELDILETEVKLKREEVHASIEQLENDYSSEATYVESIANGNVEVILAAGFTPVSTASSRIQITQPQNFKCSKSNIKGSLSFSWTSVKGAKSYIVRSTADVNDIDSWVILAVVTRVSINVEQLASGSKLWFCVSAVGASGEGPISEPIGRVVPQLRCAKGLYKGKLSGRFYFLVVLLNRLNSEVRGSIPKQDNPEGFKLKEFKEKELE